MSTAIERCLSQDHTPFVVIGDPDVESDCTRCCNQITSTCSCGTISGLVLESDSDFALVKLIETQMDYGVPVDWVVAFMCDACDAYNRALKR